eukprot:8437804-Pyramimonas_sp.AAC.2
MWQGYARAGCGMVTRVTFPGAGWAAQADKQCAGSREERDQGQDAGSQQRDELADKVRTPRRSLLVGSVPTESRHSGRRPAPLLIAGGSGVTIQIDHLIEAVLTCAIDHLIKAVLTRAVDHLIEAVLTRAIDHLTEAVLTRAIYHLTEACLTCAFRYDDERALAQDLSRENATNKAQHEAKVAQMEQVMRMETSRRDREIERFRGLVHTLEGELRSLRAQVALQNQSINSLGKDGSEPATPSGHALGRSPSTRDSRKGSFRKNSKVSVHAAEKAEAPLLTG